MKEDEAKLQRAKLDCDIQRTRLEEAKIALREGKMKLLSDYNAGVDKLEKDIERAELTLAYNETYVTQFQHELDHPFEKRDD